jgi:hypothetical protein
MASYPTTPVFIVKVKGWDEKYLAHPAVRYLKDCTNAWDSGEAKKMPWDEWNSTDFTYRKGDGVSVRGEAGFNAMLKDYSPMAAHVHEPRSVACWETQNGWEILAEAMLYLDLPVPGAEKKQADLTGRKWDLAVPGMFRFVLVKEAGSKHDGLKTEALEANADGSSVLIEMVKRGMVKPEQLLG